MRRFPLKGKWRQNLKQIAETQNQTDGNKRERKFFNGFSICILICDNWEEKRQTKQEYDESKEKEKKKNSSPKAVSGQRRSVVPVPCLCSVWFKFRGSRAAAPKETKSCRTRGESVRLSIHPSVHPFVPPPQPLWLILTLILPNSPNPSNMA